MCWTKKETEDDEKECAKRTDFLFTHFLYNFQQPYQKIYLIQMVFLFPFEMRSKRNRRNKCHTYKIKIKIKSLKIKV